MSEPGMSFDEEAFSPDIFSDGDAAITTNHTNSDDSSSASIGVNEPETSDDLPEWKGISMDEIRKGIGIYESLELPPICHSPSHIVLISLPLCARGPPKPYPSHQVDKWCQGYVRMPHSMHSVYPIDQSRSKRCRNRWEIIQESLLQNFVSTHQLETAILSYNHIYAQRWDFIALHHFFSEEVDEEETKLFFETLMPKMVHLALQLPVLITGPVPLLKRHTNGAISLSQLQIASLLANAFFCTFPRRNSTNPQSEYGTYPYINFNRLFSAYKEEKRNRCQSVMEKMKCLLHYFRRVTSKAPEGIITIQRRYIPKQDCPKWNKQEQKKLPLLHITSKGAIETDGAGLLQVDFANKYVGGGVLGFGCVQEEIRFAICPELIATMLITEELDDTEALIVCGVERYSKYKGYSNSFKWMGDFVDETPKDSSGRRLTSIVAIDALYFKRPEAQFSISNVTRELNKAYVGFIGCEGSKDSLPAIATGNWGCGAFRGNPKLKILLQLMAAGITGRSMVYFTFGDTNLRDEVAEMYWHFVQYETDIAQIYSLLMQYQEFAQSANSDFYGFLYNRSKIKPLSRYFSMKSKTNESVQKEQNTFRRSKSLNTDNKQSLLSDMRQQTTEEDMIRSWLDFEDDIIDNEKVEAREEKSKELKRSNTEDKCMNDILQGENTNGNHIEDNDSAEKKRKQSFWKLLEDKEKDNATCEHRLSGLELLDAQQEITPCQVTNERDASKVVKQQSLTHPMQLNNKNEISNQNSIDSKKHLITVKNTGQRKISDFFQRTS